MLDKTFGWVQEAYTIANLKGVVKVFVLGSDVNIKLKTDKIPRLISEEYERDKMIKYLDQSEIKVPYSLLKGKGTPKGYTRSNAPCSGIVQAVLTGQRKEYQSDWPADSFLRWAVSIGFLDYDRNDDTCSITDNGRKYALSVDNSIEEYEVLRDALLSNPPVCRIMQLLDKYGHLTKFEIGCQLGFVGEDGFTTIPQRMILQGLSVAKSQKEISKLLQDTEGTADKYVRTICSWLITMGWVEKNSKEVSTNIDNSEYWYSIGQAYRLTLKGRKELKYASGSSKFKRVPKRVPWEMLATKPSDRNYLRNRRTYIIKYISTTYRTIDDIITELRTNGINEDSVTITDDIRGLENIGLSISRKGNSYKLMDTIVGLEIPSSIEKTPLAKSDLSVIKDSIRKQLTHLDHKYLLLIDLGFDGKRDRDYEMQTAELLTGELSFKGARLGDTRKPDVCIYYDKNGLIIDNKAYGKGYSLPIKQADEMLRYIEENKTRQSSINPNEWWKIFDDTVTNFNFAFISGEFIGGFRDRIKNISLRSQTNGCVINSVNLLLLAEKLKSGEISYVEAFEKFGCNDEVKIAKN